MARGQQAKAELSELEKQRLKNIAERDAALSELKQQARGIGLQSRPKPTNGASKPIKKKAPIQRVKQEEVVPRRTSSRLAGIQADSEVAKRKADQEYEAAQEAARVKRQRISGDLALGDILVAGKKSNINGFGLGVDVVNRGARPYERTFGEEDIKETTNKDLRKLRENFNSLNLWEAWEPNDIKLTPERIYSMTMHPDSEKPLVFAGDKLGHLGIIDAHQKGPPDETQIKAENGEDEEETDQKPKKRSIDNNPGDTDPEDSEDEDDDSPQITTIKPHSRTISSMLVHPSSPDAIHTASYDSSIRSFSFSSQVATELYAPPDPSEDAPVSSIDMSPLDPHTLYFTTLYGSLLVHDTRSPTSSATSYALTEKKIGGMSLHPLAPHYLATASLDRTMRLWDLRSLSKKKMPACVATHESRLSVSHAAFNAAGQIATASYDDTIKIHSFPSSSPLTSTPAGTSLDSDDKPMHTTTISHNNQTGRWVTILKPAWQASPTDDGVQKFCIGNMNRFVDLYTAEGDQLAQLGGPNITAVPAVACWHRTRAWVAAGTASGKLCLWM